MSTMLHGIRASLRQRKAVEYFLSNGGDKVDAYLRTRQDKVGAKVTPAGLVRRANQFFNTAIMKQLMAAADVMTKMQMERKSVAGLETAIDKYGITKDRIMAELAKIAFAQQTDVMSWGPGGVVVKDSSELGDAAAAVGEISGGGEAPIKVKMLDKRQALIDLGREIGMFSQKVEHKGAVAIAAKFVIEK